MSFELYYATRDPEALAIHDKVMADLNAWQKDVWKLITDWGFDGYRARDFRAPYGFMKKPDPEADRIVTRRVGPPIDGFKGGDRVYGDEGPFFEYTLHGKHPMTKERKRELEALAARHEQPELNSGFSSSASDIICRRLGVMSEAIVSGKRLMLSAAWKMHSGDLCIQVPVSKKDGVWILPEVGGIWTELTTSQMVEHFNQHNAWARAQDGDA